jgi:hypothetical protein
MRSLYMEVGQEHNDRRREAISVDAVISSISIVYTILHYTYTYFRICMSRGPGLASNQSPVLLTPRRLKNWARYSASVSKQPRAQLVIDVALVF